MLPSTKKKRFNPLICQPSSYRYVVAVHNTSRPTYFLQFLLTQHTRSIFLVHTVHSSVVSSSRMSCGLDPVIFDTNFAGYHTFRILISLGISLELQCSFAISKTPVQPVPSGLSNLWRRPRTSRAHIYDYNFQIHFDYISAIFRCLMSALITMHI